MTRAARCLAVATAVCATWIASGAGAAVTPEPFKIKDTQNLVDLCGADANDPMYDDAINFCHGFVAGAWQFHQAQADGPNGERIVCPPDPPPTRAEAVALFVDWARAHPQYMNDPAVETLFRFLTERWPCPEPAKKGGKK